jgi:trimethylamine--corrinoid protein Co-methyltransferase
LALPFSRLGDTKGAEAMASDRPAIEPIKSAFRFQFHSDEQLDQLRAATLSILENVGVKFPSARALTILADNGCAVDAATQIVRFPRDVVLKHMASVPRYFTLAARDAACDLDLSAGCTYFTNDGCGAEAIDPVSGERRPSRKEDVARMAHISDYLSAISFFWPPVAATDRRKNARLHELDAAFNNTTKHVQGMVLGVETTKRAIEMATVVAGGEAERRRRPPLSSLICTVQPLMQDEEGIEAAMLFAEAGVPVGFMSMPTYGTTAPATIAGALAMGDAEIISATVLVQMLVPGAAVFHSMIANTADPRTGNYVPKPLNRHGRQLVIEMAHHWGMPTLGGCFGTASEMPGTWQSASEVAIDPYIAGLVGSELVTGIGLNNVFTLLWPHAIILDADIYHRARWALTGVEISDETLALDVIAKVGPGGHFLSEQHTRRHMRESFVGGLQHQPGPDGHYRDPLEVARERADWILANHTPVPLPADQRAELTAILAAADREVR